MSTPFRNQLGNGQHTLFCLAAMAVSLMSFHENKVLSGFSLALSWLKYTVTFPLSLFFLSAKGIRVVLVAVGIHLVLTLFVSFWIQLPPWEFFFGPVSVGMVSTSSGDMDLMSLATGFKLSRAFFAFLWMVLFLASLYLSMKNKSEKNLTLISFLSMSAYALFFHLDYDLVILVFPLWALFKNGIKSLWEALTALLIFSKWYLDRLFEILAENFSFFQGFPGFIQIVNLFLFYSVLVLLFLHLSGYRFEFKKKPTGVWGLFDVIFQKS